MDDGALILASYAIAILIIYSLLARGLFRATEELRFSLLDISEPLLESNALTENDKKSINRALSQVHSAIAAWKMVAALISAIYFLFFKKNRIEVQELRSRIPNNLREQYRTFSIRWIVAVLGNSPLASLLFTIIIVLLCVFIASTMPIAYIILRQQSDRKAKDRCAQAAH